MYLSEIGVFESMIGCVSELVGDLRDYNCNYRSYQYSSQSNVRVKVCMCTLLFGESVRFSGKLLMKTCHNL